MPSHAGSVKRARERAAAGLPYENPPLPSLLPAPAQRLPALPTRSIPQNIAAISNPTPISQWPLKASFENVGAVPVDYRRPPPRRPPRPTPSRAPSMLDSTPIFRPQQQQQEEQQQLRAPVPASHSYQRGQPERGDFLDLSDAMYSPVESTYGASSRASTVSSVGSIPEFPMVSHGPRRSANPPPSSRRRGVSSYYSQASYVTPIIEVSESPNARNAHHSYASSAAMPSAWGGDSPGYRSDDYADAMDDSGVEDVFYGRAESYDDHDGASLIRSASMGKRARPAIVSTRSADKTEPVPLPEKVIDSSRPGYVGSSSAAVGAAGFVRARKASISERSSTGDLTMVDPNKVTLNSASAASSSTEATVLQALQAASSPDPATTGEAIDPDTQATTRRPPRLNMDAVRDAEARGSLTSLPDLIRRATRLAYMIERGKRPGSSMGLNDFPFPPSSKHGKSSCKSSHPSFCIC